MCILLTHINRSKQKGDEKLQERIEYCIKHGTYIYYPDVNESGDKWKIKGGGLLAPLKNIKGFSDREVNNIVNNRPYVDLKDFLDKTKFNEKRFEQLLFARCFDKWGKVEDLYNWYYNFYVESNKKSKKETLTESLFDFDVEEDTSSQTITTFTKNELEEKCVDLNGFIIPDNIMMKYSYVYNGKLRDFSNQIDPDSKVGRSKIYKLSDLDKMEKKDTSDPVWVLVQVKNIAEGLKTKKGNTFSKITVNDGEKNLTLFIWQSKVPNVFKKGNVMIIPLKVVTDDEKKENNISYCSWMADKVDLPVIFAEE